MFYNTTNEAGPQLSEYALKAEKQEEAILELFHKHPMMTPSQALSKYIIGTGKNAPLTSIRRSFSNLTDEGKLEMTNEKMKGGYGRNEHFWKLVE